MPSMMPPCWTGGLVRASAALKSSSGREVALFAPGGRPQQQHQAGHCFIATRYRCYSYHQASRSGSMARTRRKYQQVPPPPPPPPRRIHHSQPPAFGDNVMERSRRSDDWQVHLTFVSLAYGAVLFTSFVVSVNGDRRLKTELAKLRAPGDTDLVELRDQGETESVELEKNYADMRARKGDQRATIQEPSNRPRTEVDLKLVEHYRKMAELDRELAELKSETAELNKKTVELRVQLGDNEMISIEKLIYAEMAKRNPDAFKTSKLQQTKDR